MLNLETGHAFSCLSYSIAIFVDWLSGSYQ